jgi:hypothetical protein
MLVVNFEEPCGDTFLSHLFKLRFVLMPLLPQIIGWHSRSSPLPSFVANRADGLNARSKQSWVIVTVAV